MLYTARGVGNLDVVDDAWVVRKYGILPEQYADFATLRGDTSDGLPGVKGVGDKTATSLLQQYGDLDGIVAAATIRRSRWRLASAARSCRRRTTSWSRRRWSPWFATSTCPRWTARSSPLTRGAVAVVTELSKRWALGSSATRLVDVLATYG